MSEKLVRLSDVIPSFRPPENKAGLEKLEKLKVAATALREAGNNDYQLRDKLNDAHSKARADLLGFYVPPAERNGISYPEKDALALALASPVVETAAILDIANTAGLALIPVEFLGHTFLQSAPHEASQFRTLPRQIWVLAPITAFDMVAFVGDTKSNNEPLLPGASSFLFPLLVMIKDLYSKQANTSREMESLKQRVSSLETRMTQMEHHFEVQRAYTVALANRETSYRRRIALEDPLMLAGNPHKDKRLIVGPCWGPPLPKDLLMTILGQIGSAAVQHKETEGNSTEEED